MSPRDTIGGRKVVGSGKIIGSKLDFTIYPFDDFPEYIMQVIVHFNESQVYVNNKISVSSENENGCTLTITLSWGHVQFQPTANAGIAFSHFPKEQFYISYVLQMIGSPSNFVINFDYLTLSEPVV